MQTSDVSAAGAAAAAKTARPGKEAEPGGLDADFETFLTLLTAQLRNQDPLDPQDPTQFVAQLAQFSSVEQQVRANSKLDAILSALGGEATSTLSNWLGTRVETDAALRFDGAPIELTADLAPQATTAALVVKTEAGLEVDRVAFDPQAEKVSWDGGGETPGVYRFTVEQSAGDAPLPDAAARGFADVVEARLGDSGVELLLGSGERIDAETVTAVRRADD